MGPIEKASVFEILVARQAKITDSKKQLADDENRDAVAKRGATVNFGYVAFNAAKRVGYPMCEMRSRCSPYVLVCSFLPVLGMPLVP